MRLSARARRSATSGSRSGRIAIAADALAPDCVAVQLERVSVAPRACRRYFIRMKIGLTACMLACSNVFMTFAWYGHLKNLSTKPWIVAALISWGIALFEYLIQVPANRIGHSVMDLGQLKLLQEVITLVVFVPFSIWYMKQPLRLDFLWAGLCLMGAVYFVFRA
jgi:uncharacterized protein (DUF486 family)